jgi:predicted exporter
VITPEEQSPDAGGMVSPWRGTTAELVTAGLAVTVTAVAGYAVAGWAGLAVVAVATAAGIMVLLRFLLPQLTPDTAKKARERPRARTLTGYSHRRFMVRSALTSQNYYDFELRPLLEHLLAARLAERHGVHLYQDPDTARRLLCRGLRDAGLWRWIDPSTRPQNRDSQDRRAIPRHTLARLIDRLEKL